MNSSLKLKPYLDSLKKELNESLLFFWMDRCLDRKNGGYFNCFTNDGSRLIATDKYTWSQGRFLWMFSRLASTKSELFCQKERETFLSFAKSGRDFLMKHVLLPEAPLRCAFLTDAEGNPKTVEGHEGYDLSISADCFVVMGFAAYSRAAGDAEAFRFAKDLGESVYERYESGNYRSLPYPVPRGYQTHAKPMILTHLFCELYRSALLFDPEYAALLLPRLEQCHEEIFRVFADENDLIHEFSDSEGNFTDSLFCQHVNPGHTLEDLWFQWEAADLLKQNRHRDRISKIAVKTLELGWDAEFGGIYHFVPCDGIETEYQAGEMAEEAQMKLVLDDWGSKLWWVHSEAIYTSLLLYLKTENEAFFQWFQKIFDYTFRTFPNPDPTVREWIQIRTREGLPQDKVVALPVKDPYHIIRNVLMCIELLESEEKGNER